MKWISKYGFREFSDLIIDPYLNSSLISSAKAEKKNLFHVILQLKLEAIDDGGFKR
ncbi:MAG: hypothetical protein ABI760_17350 [Ferruginibacter sp.]